MYTANSNTLSQNNSTINSNHINDHDHLIVGRKNDHTNTCITATKARKYLNYTSHIKTINFR